MKKSRFTYKLIVVGLVALAVSSLKLAAEPLNVKIRADDGDLWRLWDNPALIQAQRTPLAFGLRTTALDKIWQDSNSQAGLDLTFATPGLAYSLTYDALGFEYRVATAIKFGEALGLGYAYDYLTTNDDVLKRFILGGLFRPVDFCSLAVTLDSGFEGDPVFGFGLGLRPLIFAPKLTSAFTLTADARYDDQFVLESAGAKLALGDLAKLRTYWDFEHERLGAELSISLGPIELGSGTNQLQDPLPSFRVDETLKLLSSDGLKKPFTKKILHIKQLDAVTAAPEETTWFSSLINPSYSLSVSELCSLFRRAAADRSVVALVLSDFPAMTYPAAVQELADAIEVFKATGKKFYVYADELLDSNSYSLLLAKADHIALNPNGRALIMGWGTIQPYLKGLFDKFGIHFINWAPWPTKSANNIFSESSMPAEERAMLERYLGDLQAQAEMALEAARGKKLSAPAKAIIAAGPYFSADKALSAGLVDALAYRADFEASLETAYPSAAFVSDLAETADEAWGPSLLAKKVAVVWCIGNIEDNTGGLAGINISQTTAEELRRLREDPFTAGILLRVDSGGGSALVSDIIANEVQKTVQAGKPVVVSMGDLAASGGYYISAYAERIFADPATLTGSIGVTSLTFELTALAEKLGITAETVATSPSALFMNPFEELRPEDEAVMQAYIMEIYERFIDVVATGRGLKPEAVHAIAEGRIWTGREALEKGLVDELGGLDTAMAWLESRLGGRTIFVDVFPDQDQSLLGIVRQTTAQLSAFLGLGQNRFSSQLEELAGPAIDQLASIVRLGSGPLYYWPGLANWP